MSDISILEYLIGVMSLGPDCLMFSFGFLEAHLNFDRLKKEVHLIVQIKGPLSENFDK